MDIKPRRLWRRDVKKLQRKRRRQKLARERDKKLEESELVKLKDPAYNLWLEHQEYLDEEQRREQQDNEEIWLRRELLAQKQFQREQQIRIAEERAKEEVRERQYKEKKEREEALQRKKDEIKRKAEQVAKELEETVQLCQNYLDDPSMRTPSKLQDCIETRPGEKECEFYMKTQCCRFGPCCSYNHKNPLLSRVIVIRNFFQHRLLDQQIHQEYTSAEEQIEVSERDLRNDYDEFCADVWPELEQFGEIVNFRTVRNRLPHARGHVFVEYVDKRSALRAFTKLQNRFYASKRLQVEFSHITHWRTAVCGFSLARKCPKGAYCNYLHLIRNPENKYNAPLGSLDRSQRSQNNSNRQQETPSIGWNNITAEEGTPNRRRNWRWSESPETEIFSKGKKIQESSGQRKIEKEIPPTTEQNSKKADSIVLSSSSSEDEEDIIKKRNRKYSSQIEEQNSSNNFRTTRTTKWNQKEAKPSVHISVRQNSCKSKSTNESIIISSSSSEYEEDGEVRRKVERNRTSHSTKNDEKYYRRDKEGGRNRHTHKKRRSSEKRHHSSRRSCSPYSKRSYKSSSKNR